MGLGKSFKKIVGGALGALNLPLVSGALVGIGGGLLERDAAASEASKQREAQDRINQQNYDMQKEFAQHGIRWKVEDAKAAGLHPLAALGATGASASPSFQIPGEDHSKSNFYRSAGQDISRAIAATSTAEERMMRRLQIERMSTENELMKIDLDRARRTVMNPGFPADGNSGIGGIPGQGDSSLPVQIMPTGRTASALGKPHQAYGNVTGWSYVKHPDGSLEPISSPDIQGNKANDILEMIRFHINTFAHKYGNPKSLAPSYQDNPLPPGYEWEFRNWTGRYHPVRSDKKRPWFQRLRR